VRKLGGRKAHPYFSEDKPERLLTETAKDALLHVPVVLALAATPLAGRSY
jgi:hypothetical protein